MCGPVGVWGASVGMCGPVGRSLRVSLALRRAHFARSVEPRVGRWPASKRCGATCWEVASEQGEVLEVWSHVSEVARMPASKVRQLDLTPPTPPLRTPALLERAGFAVARASTPTCMPEGGKAGRQDPREAFVGCNTEWGVLQIHSAVWIHTWMEGESTHSGLCP
eukprot:365092-Chlamydomonas_euryale.AAC.8